MTTVKMKSGDTAIEFTSSLETDGVAVNLTGASVLFLLKLSETPFTAYSLAASIVGTATDGNVKSLSSESGFPTTVGKYKQEWQVTFSGGAILTFPSDDYNYLVIQDDLN
jgi:hypothetical protein